MFSTYSVHSKNHKRLRAEISGKVYSVRRVCTEGHNFLSDKLCRCGATWVISQKLKS